MAVPWADDAQQAKDLLDQSRRLRDVGQFSEAAKLSRQAYDLEPSAFAAARYIHCLRKQGTDQARAAVVFGGEPIERWPADEWLIREYVWAVYDGYLKASAEAEDEEEAPADDRRNFDVMVKAARRILKLSQEELPRKRAVFAICREAKARRRWPLVLEFALVLDRSKLSDEAQEQNGETLPSDLQRWLYCVTRAYLELEQYDKCLQYAREGIERYPGSLFFPWWHALAHVRRGNLEAGLHGLEQVYRRCEPQWYLRRDIAEAHERLQRNEDAWRWYCAAASSPGEMKSRIPMLLRMAELLERLERWPLALDHLLLVWALAAQEKGWEKLTKRNSELVAEILQRHARKLGLGVEPPEAPPNPEPLLASCRKLWLETGRDVGRQRW